MKELAAQVELGAAATDTDYLAFVRSVNANVKSGARIRHQILLRKLLAFDPAAIYLFGPATVAESGIPGGVKSKADRVADLVGAINESYAASNGRDLFKATNKTTTSLVRLGRLVNTFDRYKTFIEDLYFLFHEGVGDRLDGKIPSSFADVSLLRTGLQHDVDHGKTAKVRAKLKAIGSAFETYSGMTSPAGMDPEHFSLVQLNLLNAIERDLVALKKGL
jgi:hypothetical protein